MFDFLHLKKPVSIPKIIHYVWIGDKPIPKKNQKYINSWKNNNPDYTIMLWNEKNIDFSVPYLKNAYKLKYWANISNYVRMKAVQDYGGIYLDTDILALKSFDPLLKNKCFFGFCLKKFNSDQVNNTPFGAIKNHWFVKKTLRELTKQFDGSEAANVSAPRLVTTLLRKEGLKGYSRNGLLVKDIFIYPIETFNPFNWLEKYDSSYITKKTYTLHFWEKRW